MEILYQTESLIAVNKPAGIPVIPDLTTDPSAISILSKQLSITLYPINRLDRPASGLVLFAKSQEYAALLNQVFKDRNATKIYFAAVRNNPEPPGGSLVNFLVKKNYKAYISSQKKQGKKAVLKYKTIGKTDHYHILEIELITGRFHQIRAQLSNIGSPIKGDVKYGARRSNKDRSIHLHARSLEFIHPLTNETICINAPLPNEPLWNYYLSTLEK